MKVTPSQLVAFVFMSDMNCTTLAYMCHSVNEVISMLETRGAVLAFTGDIQDIVMVGVNNLGGCVIEKKIELQLSLVEMWKKSNSLEFRFLTDSVVGICVLSSMKKSLKLTRTGVRKEEDSITVNYQDIIDLGMSLIVMLGDDKENLNPCQDLRQLMVEAVHRAETVGAVSQIPKPRVSQYGASGDGGRHRSRGWREIDCDDAWCDSNRTKGTDTKLVVGSSQKGRTWLYWVSGLIRYRIRNMVLTLRVILNHSKEEIFSVAEIVRMVSDEVETRKSKGWRESELVSESDVTNRSIRALASLDLVNLCKKEGVMLVHIVQKQELAELMKVISEFRC